MNEEIVVILDANVSMGEEMDEYRMGSEDFLGTTKFDVARYIVQELLFQAACFSRTSLEDQTRILALVTLGEGQSNSSGMKRKRPWSPLEDNETVVDSSNYDGCCCYLYNEHDHRGSIDRFGNLLQSIRVSSRSSHGDFVQGIICATDAMWKHSTVGAGRRRMVLVTDARHKVLQGEEDPMEGLARAVNTLRSMGCTLEVVGMGFRREKVCNPTTKMLNNSAEAINSSCNAKAESEVESDGDDSESDEESSNDDEDDDDDWSDVQDQNELLVIDLVEKLGGRIQVVNGGSLIDDIYGVEMVLKQLAIPFEKSSINSKPKEASTFEPPYDIVVKEEPIEQNNHENFTEAGSIVEKSCAAYFGWAARSGKYDT